MAVVAREGSHLIKKHREQKERKKAMHKDWELAGSKMGQVLGVKSKDDEDEREDDETNFKVFDRHLDIFLLYLVGELAIQSPLGQAKSRWVE